MQENVAALVSEKFMPDFQKWLAKLESLGYVNRWARLNAKDYGVPQNRDRVFCLSMRRDVAFDYQFPEGFPLQTRLEDVLEEEVTERFFLKDNAVEKFLKANDTDKALFMQFDLPPTHDAAMFLKTWLQMWMRGDYGFDDSCYEEEWFEENGYTYWDLTPSELQETLENIKEDLCQAHLAFSNKELMDEEFSLLFQENMKRRPKDENR